MKKVFLENLPTKIGVGANANKLTIDWVRSVGSFVEFIYNDIAGTVEIIDYNSKESNLTIKYNKNEYNIKASDLKRCKLYRILNKITKDFKVEIGTNFKDDKRDITITDREYREKNYIKKDGSKNNCSQKWYKYKCNICGYKDGWIVESSLIGKQKSGCAVCCKASRIIIKDVNDVATTHPYLVKYFKNIEDAYNYSFGSSKRVWFKCPDCGFEKKLSISQISKDGFSCLKCSDGISYPNKFTFNLLEQLKIKFIPEYSPNWIGQKRYDFYIPSMNLIIEMDGGLGHGKGKHNKNKLTVEELKTIDDYKDEQAKLHGIEVIRINCDYDSMKNRFEHIKQNIISNEKINKSLDLTKIDWNKCNNFALSDLIKIACEIKKNNPNLTTTEIGKIMGGYGRGTIRSWLKIGCEKGLCNYDTKIELNNKNNKMKEKKNGNPIICINTKDVFHSITNCAERSLNVFGVKLTSSCIIDVCKGKQRNTKGFIFKYIKDLTSDECIKYNV